jgi:hypothetical protein
LKPFGVETPLQLPLFKVAAEAMFDAKRIKDSKQIDLKERILYPRKMRRKGLMNQIFSKSTTILPLTIIFKKTLTAQASVSIS